MPAPFRCWSALTGQHRIPVGSKRAAVVGSASLWEERHSTEARSSRALTAQANYSFTTIVEILFCRCNRLRNFHSDVSFRLCSESHSNQAFNTYPIIKARSSMIVLAEDCLPAHGSSQQASSHGTHQHVKTPSEPTMRMKIAAHGRNQLLTGRQWVRSAAGCRPQNEPDDLVPKHAFGHAECG